MLTALTLICNPRTPIVDDALAAQVLRLFEEMFDVRRVRRSVLSEGVADDFVFDFDDEPGALRAAVGRRLAGRPVDLVVQPAQGRRKRLLVADMESTIIGQECLDELASCAGKRPEVAAITERAMRGEIDFETALRDRAAMLRGAPAGILEEVQARVTMNPGAQTLVRTMKSMGATTALVSGGFSVFAERVAADCGFDVQESNELLIANGALTGEVARPIRGRAAKEETLLRLAALHGVKPAEVVAVGDGANDLGMLARAGLGVAYHAKPAIAAAAAARIDHGDLTALLYLQGVAQVEFST